MKIENIEVFAVGTWNGRTFDRADLDGMVAAFDALGLAGKIPAKLGHSAPDTEPAQGWITALRRQDDKLLATLDQVPAELVDKIKAGRWRHVSIELLLDVRRDGETYPFVPDGLALLGSARPAVTALEGLHKLVAAALPGLAFQERLAFSLDDDEIATALREVRELKRELDARAGRVQAAEVLAVQLKDANTKLIAQTFAAAIRDGKCLPAAREQFARRHGTTGTVADAIEFIASCPRPPARGPASRAQVPDDDADAPADFRLTARARRLIREHRRETGETLSFSAAAATVVKLPENSALVAEWRTMMGET